MWFLGRDKNSKIQILNKSIIKNKNLGEHFQKIALYIYLKTTGH